MPLEGCKAGTSRNSLDSAFKEVPDPRQLQKEGSMREMVKTSQGRAQGFGS